MATSLATVGRAQFLTGIVTLASIDTNTTSSFLGYFNSILGGAAILYDFLQQSVSGALAEKL